VLPPAAALERDIVGLGVAELGRIFPTAPINMPGAGLVASLGRPGGNTTGLANMTEDLTPKVVDILRIVVPKAARIAVLYNPANPSNNPMLERIEGSIKKSGGAVHATPFRSAEIEATFAAIATASPNALVVVNDATIIDMRERIASPALVRGGIGELGERLLHHIIGVGRSYSDVAAMRGKPGGEPEITFIPRASGIILRQWLT
jgi:hypothetical protein